MAKFHLSIEADSIEELMGLFAQQEHHWVPRDIPALAKDEGLASALAEGEKVKRPRRTKAEMEADAAKQTRTEPLTQPKVDEAGPDTGQPKGNGAAAELTITDVREAAADTLKRHGSNGDKIKEALEANFGTRMFSKLEPHQYEAAITMLKDL